MNHIDAEPASRRSTQLLIVLILLVCVIVTVVPAVLVTSSRRNNEDFTTASNETNTTANGTFFSSNGTSFTDAPTETPSEATTHLPTRLPTRSPTANPNPSGLPTITPSASPSLEPSASSTSKTPTVSPTWTPSTSTPTAHPTIAPSNIPSTVMPTKTPTAAPTSKNPTTAPSASSTSKTPTLSPTWTPSTGTPTAHPTLAPSNIPSTQMPTAAPTSKIPTAAPTTLDPITIPTALLDLQFATIVDSFVVLDTIAHAPDAFTQGLTFDPEDSAVVYESTGLTGRSSVRKVDIASGEVLLKVDTPPEVFGEGLAYYTSESDGRLIHITWKSRRGFIFDADTLDMLEQFTYSTQTNEGWGITYVPTLDQFLVTDGSNVLHFWDRDLREVGRLAVTMRTSAVSIPERVFNLNEIEWDNETGTLLANIWQTDNIVRIDITTGAVLTLYDLAQLYPNRPFSADVLNGIAINPENELWVTGKLWPTMFKIEFIER
ncbi:Glutamine cyclotransferase [Seminavis robusta]|uniref:Glutamine cyclotransferase n=1 Tax=Seminavis robusta TaxID=568900 RepID=A0A9N8H5T6_9STRA|nr:Glutamine cyclotransferase [Seminavis robusta]|eukprot:Sro30_g019850.1 Glutamine cyclotransferase (489) ;mRNA; f:139887-141492